ncbi:MAG: hypothetical protein ACJ74D_13710 [Gaiellaceae bacterium]
MRRRILLVLAVGAASALWAATVAGGAGPSPGLALGGNGVANGSVRYVTVQAGSSTLLTKIDRKGGRVLRSMTLKGVWGIPLVSFDGTAEGLFAGGRTLLLAQSLFSGQTLRKNTTFRLVDVRRMQVRGTIRLAGAYSFDALSPDGRYLYLVEYVSPEDPSLYRVRAYDLRGRKLLARIITDKRSWETGMRGSPVTRAWKDGWAYTLYGGNDRPFIHALDTRNAQAVCIFMPWKSSPDRMFDYRLRVDGDGHLVVSGPNGRALVVIDRQTFKVLSSVANP